MGKAKAAGRPVAPLKATTSVQGAEEIVKRVHKESAEVERLPAFQAIRHPDLRAFWEKCIGRDEVSWDTFWLHFPTGLAPEVLVDCAFGSQKERSAFQAAMHVVGAPEHINVSMIDAAFAPGAPVGVTTARLLKDSASEVRMLDVAKRTGQHVPLGLQSAGFWDEPAPPLPALAALAGEVETELCFADGQRTSVAQIVGHNASGAAGVAAVAARRMLDKGFWSGAVCVGAKGAHSAESMAARLASALRILSYPVVTDELLRLTAYFHSRASQPGRLGIVLDAEGCTSADEIHAVSVLATTVVKAGGGSVQIVVAGEGVLQLSASILHATFRVQAPSREEEIAFMEGAGTYYLESSAAAVAAACGHQLGLEKLAVANLQTGKTSPQTLIHAMCASVPAGPDSPARPRELPAETVVAAVAAALPAEERDAVYRLAVLPHAFSAQAAAQVLGQKEESDAVAILQTLEDKGFIRKNLAMCVFGMQPSVRAVLRSSAPQKAEAAFEAATIALINHSLGLAETAAALNASNAQMAAMWAIDREREIFDEVISLLGDHTALPAVSTGLYADLVSKHLDLLGFRLSLKQQSALCTACAQAARQGGDALAEAHSLQHLGQLGSVAAADGAMARAMAAVEKALTPSHPVIADMLLSWARLQLQAGNMPQAERLLRRSLEIQLQQAPGKALAIAATRTRLAGVLVAQGASQRARPYLQTALDATAAELGAQHPDTALAQCRLASCLADLKEYEGAYSLYLLALDGWRMSLGHCHPQFATLLGQLAFCCGRLRKPDDAEQYYRRSIQMWKEMMVLDQPELQDDLRALADILQSQGRGVEAHEIREQLHRLIEAVRAAQSRVTRQKKARRSGLRRALLRPLKALCIPTRSPQPAFVALPAGIQDSDLEELRNADKASDEPHTIEIQAEAHGTAAAGTATMQPTPASSSSAQHAATPEGTPAADETAGALGEPASAQNGPQPSALEQLEQTEDPAADAPEASASQTVVVEFEADTAGKLVEVEASEEGSQASARSGKPTPRQQHRAAARAKEVYIPPHLAPFGSKGAPSPVEASVWAASLRNPAISIGSAPKRASALSAAGRNDSSGSKSRLFAPSEARYRTAKPGTFHKGASAGGAGEADDLIRAHTGDEKDWPETGELARQASDGGRRAGEVDGAEYGIQLIPARTEARGVGHARGEGEVVLGDSVAAGEGPVGKGVIGFFNPMFSQFGISRSSSQAASVFDDKVEI